MYGAVCCWVVWQCRSKHKDSYTTLDDYIGRMKEGQKQIYYLTGSSIEQLGEVALPREAAQEGIRGERKGLRVEGLGFGVLVCAGRVWHEDVRCASRGVG